jgi:hypothetical protein
LAEVSKEDDQARAIAERVARRLGADASPRVANHSVAKSQSAGTQERPRARIIDFVAAGPPVRSVPSVSRSSAGSTSTDSIRSNPQTEFFQFVPVTQSPWLGRLSGMLGGASPQPPIPQPQSGDHPSEDRFGIEEAAVTELVEFFENEKKCSVDPSGKPCDHCAMCSSRGF